MILTQLICVHFISGCDMCQGKSVGLARYPTTLVEDRGSVSTTAECADNAHVRDGSSLSITCTSNGEWSQTITPVCDCDDEYEEVKDNSGRSICQGQCVQLYLCYAFQLIQSLSSTAKFTCFSNTSNADCGKILKYFCQKPDSTIFTFLICRFRLQNTLSNTLLMGQMHKWC